MARLLWMSSRPVKAYIFFKLASTNGRGLITTDDIRNFYKCYQADLKFQHNNNKRERIIDIFLRGLHIDEYFNQELTIEQFYNILQQMSMHVRNNLHRIVFLLAYILTTVALIVFVIVLRVDHEKNHNGWQVTARIGGELISFHFALAVTLMLKETVTIIRRIRWLRRFIPVDDHIDAHKIVGSMLFFWTMLHTLGYIGHYATHTTEHTWTESMFTTAAGQGWVYHSSPITGNILFLLLLIMVICFVQCIRQRTGCFALFSYTHQIFWLLFILLIIHAQNFWKWTVAPTGLFLLEKLYSFKMCFPSYGKTLLLEVIIEDENVLVLIMRRPKNFDYKMGDYVYICLPNIAFNGWHPFTLTSTPEEKDTLRIHMMKKKNWTRKVYEHFHDMYDLSQTSSRQLEIAVRSVEQNSARDFTPQKKIVFDSTQSNAVIRIRGPCSSSTSYIFDDCDHAILIGGGIGITPYVSVLETLIHQIRSEQCTCSNCGHINQNNTIFNQRKLKKVDFIWVNREVKNFGWFIKLLEDFEAEQERYLREGHHRSRCLDIHLYFSVLPSNEQEMMTIAPYDIVANVYASVSHEDMHTALKTVRTKVGRPPWKLLFSQFAADRQPDQTTAVFFTGPATMGIEVKRHCDEHRFQFHHEPYF